MSAGVPEGFEKFEGGGDFVDMIGPLFARGQGAERVLALRVEERHRNSAGVAQGGLLATIADFALGRAIELDAGEARVTVSLTTDYLKPVPIGSWLEAHAKVDRLGGTLAFADCSLTVDGDEVVRARAVFAAAG